MLIENLLKYIAENIRYDCMEGRLYWKKSHRNHVIVNSECGCISKAGYRVLRIEGKLYRTHRIIFLIENGRMPKIIDHIDRNKLNNKITNLREVTVSQNGMNRGKTRNNLSGYKGVYRNARDNKFVAQIYVNGNHIYLGYTDTPEEAYELYKEAAQRYHGKFSNIGETTN